MLSHAWVFHSFMMPNKIPFACTWHFVCLPIHQHLAVSTLGLLGIMVP